MNAKFSSLFLVKSFSLSCITKKRILLLLLDTKPELHVIQVIPLRLLSAAVVNINDAAIPVTEYDKLLCYPIGYVCN